MSQEKDMLEMTPDEEHQNENIIQNSSPQNPVSENNKNPQKSSTPNFFSGEDINAEDTLIEAEKELEKEEHKGGFLSFFLGFLNIAMIIGIVVLIRMFVVSPFKVDGHSMDSTFADGDLILIDQLSYKFSEPKRGDIIVFYPPIERYSNQEGSIHCYLAKAWNLVAQKDEEDICRFRSHFVKRIIGVPGDTVEVKNGKVFVTPKNGDRIEIREDFLDEDNQSNTCIPAHNCENSKNWRGIVHDVDEGEFFVLGDNRKGSDDSRVWKEGDIPKPFVQLDDIAGKVRVTFWPFSHFGITEEINILEKDLSFTEE